nr:uncharacterized protein LOC123745862 [Procambarus clarkii]
MGPVMGPRSWLRWVMVMSVGVGACRGHARLVEPPSRASAWRFGWQTPIDYNDNEGFCGGLTHQHQVQGGRCGICGDAWGANPRPHEAGGRYATGTIVRRYEEGQVIPIRVHVTANHRGHFEFRLCPNNNPQVEATQTCLNQYPLLPADGSGFQQQVAGHTGEHLLHLQLPSGLTCTQCVLQWRYVAGNNWGTCEDGSARVGCGPQEEFRACADVAVAAQQTGSSVGVTSLLENGADAGGQGYTYSWYPKASLAPLFTTTFRPTLGSTRRPTTHTSIPSSSPSLTRRPRPSKPRPGKSRPSKPRPGKYHPSKPRPGKSRPSKPRLGKSRPSRPRSSTPVPVSSPSEPSKDCRAVGVWQRVPGMDGWCVQNCFHVPSFCPPSHCTCS